MESQLSSTRSRLAFYELPLVIVDLILQYGFVMLRGRYTMYDLDNALGSIPNNQIYTFTLNMQVCIDPKHSVDLCNHEVYVRRSTTPMFKQIRFTRTFTVNDVSYEITKGSFSDNVLFDSEKAGCVILKSRKN